MMACGRNVIGLFFIYWFCAKFGVICTRVQSEQDFEIKRKTMIGFMVLREISGKWEIGVRRRTTLYSEGRMNGV